MTPLEQGRKYPDVIKLAESAQRRWRSLNGYQLIPDVISGVRFVDGIKQAAA